jgi:two-component sensor histidine kinase
MLEQIRARIRAVVSIHRYLQHVGTGTGIDAAEFLDFWEEELRRSLDDCGQRDLRLRAMAESFSFPVELVLETALVVHELVLAYACTQGPQRRRGGISVGMHEERGTAVVRLRLEGSESADDAHPAPDPLGLVLVRRVAQALAGYLEVPATEAAARLVIPLGRADWEIADGDPVGEEEA